MLSVESESMSMMGWYTLDEGVIESIFRDESLPVYIDRKAWGLLKGYFYKIGVEAELTSKPHGLYLYIYISGNKVHIELKDRNETLIRRTYDLRNFVDMVKKSAN